VLFLRFVFLGKVESQRNCSIPKRVKKKLPVFLVQHVFFSHIPPKNPTKKNKNISLFLAKNRLILGNATFLAAGGAVVLWQSTGAAFSPTCRAFICSTDDYFTEIDEDGGCSRGCV